MSYCCIVVLFIVFNVVLFSVIVTCHCCIVHSVASAAEEMHSWPVEVLVQHGSDAFRYFVGNHTNREDQEYSRDQFLKLGSHV